MWRSTLFLMSMLIFVMAGCSGGTPKKNRLTVQKATKEGHVVAQNLSNQLQQIASGQVKTKNLKKIFVFAENVKKGKKDKVAISIFDQSGYSATNTLNFNGKTIAFNNHYSGYNSPTGKYKCKYMSFLSSQIELNECKNQKGKKFSTIFVMLAKKDHVKTLMNQYPKTYLVHPPSS